MIDIERACRICLENNATYNIFDEDDEKIQKKLVLCFNEKIEDIAGYPRNICLVCKNTIQAISDFKTKYQNSCKILSGETINIKTEGNYSDHEYDDYYDINIQPKIESVFIDSKDLLDTLTEVTIKRVKSEEIGTNSQNKTQNGKVKYLKDDKVNSADKAAYLKRFLKTIQRGKSAISIKKTTTSRSHKQELKKTSKKLVKKKPKNVNVKQEIKTEDKKALDKPPPTPRLCDRCGQSFDTYIQLLNHKRTHPKKTYKCDKCDKVFKVRHSLVEHIKRLHDKVVEYMCDVCGKEFYLKRQLRDHVKFSHQNKQRNKKILEYKCKYCDKVFRYKKGQIIHERAVHTGERPAVCSVCDSAFYDESYLREHMRLHTGDAPYKCPICNRGYAQRGNMKSHLRNHRISDITPDDLTKIRPSYIKYLRP